MHMFIRMTSLVATVAGLALATTPAAAATTGTPVSPSDRQATATARVVKPLTMKWKQDLDLGTIVLGSGTWTGADVSISKAKVFACTNTNVTCSGSPTTAEYTVTGTNNQLVTVNSGNVTLTNQNDTTKSLLLTVDNPGTVNLGNSGSAGYVLDLGGKVTVASDTPDGTYTGNFAVTVNY